MIFWFSGSGNSLWLAKRLAEATCDSLCSMAEMCVRENFSFHLEKEERIGFVFPVYGWDVPNVVREFIEKLSLDSRGHYCYVASTYGDDMGRMEDRIRALLHRKGMELQGIYAVQMPNTYVCLPGFDVDEESLAQEKLRKADEVVPRFCEWIQRRDMGRTVTFPGRMAWMKTYVLGTLFRRFLMKGRRFHSNGECISCGICAKSCPLFNIKMDGKVPVWGSRCAMCLSCYHHCPRHAVEYGRVTRNKKQYLMKDM